MHSILKILSDHAERTRRALARAQAVPSMAVLGLLSGLLAGTVVILFRLLVDRGQGRLLPAGIVENFEALAPFERLALAGGGGLLLGLLFSVAARPPGRVGVLHVMERLSFHEGHLTLRRALLQFAGGVVALVSGQSLGREGPSVHLGAAVSSLLGQRLRLPNNSIRTLVACGVAAAIAGSFNTPLAGVIFAMEVVMMEYTITGFVPVILASVSATAINHVVFTGNTVFLVPPVLLASNWELPGIALMGLLVGGIAAGFIRLLGFISRHMAPRPPWIRMPAGGLAAGIIAMAVPEVMGQGYDSVNLALSDSLPFGLLLAVLAAKLLATAAGVGCGLPAGLIGPSLVMGAMAGALFGILVNHLPMTLSPPEFYVMLGMGAMTGAMLRAPLAALIALLELTGNENIVLPGMLAIVTASLATQELFRQEPVFLAQFRAVGLDIRNDPVAQSLRRLGVGSVMSESFAMVGEHLGREQAEKLLAERQPRWLVISRGDERLLMPAADLARHLQSHEGDSIALLEVPSTRLQLAAIGLQSTLQQAWQQLQDSDAEALYVVQRLGAAADRVHGVLTRQHIESGYRLRP